MYRQLIMFARKYLGEQLSFLAEDCVQDAIFGAWKTRSTFRSDKNLSSYLYSAIRNKTIDARRKCNSSERYLQHQETEEDEIVSAIIEQETMNRLFKAVDSLSEKDKQLFFLCSEGLSISQIAEKMGLAESTVKQRKSHMLSHLQASINDKLLFIVFSSFSRLLIFFSFCIFFLIITYFFLLFL
mgnify:CR=1 FL=1